MEPAAFKNEIELLSGRPVASLGPKEDAALAALLREALKDDKQKIDYSQFNELLLIVNKDRVTRFFFEYFFGALCLIEDIPKGVRKFQKAAMLCFGNFIYAYHTLSKAADAQELERYVGSYCHEASDLWEHFRNRKAKILDVKEIPKDQTPLLGYISSGEIREERRIVERLTGKLLPESRIWEDLQFALDAMRESVKDEKKEVAVVDKSLRIVEKFRKASAGSTLADFQQRLEKDKSQIDVRHKTLEETEIDGNRNTDIYLTWDHMDIYFATSMRNSWEYEELFEFVSKLMNRPVDSLSEQLEPFRADLHGKTLKELNIRYFDPTQSYDKNRINKGLVEALMLKRAVCTVYSVQDTDTLGKDSELAATLAQGKPVIAYAPVINVNDKTEQLFNGRPGDLKSRLQFVLYADERNLASEETSYLLGFLPRLEEFEGGMFWRSVSDYSAEKHFQEKYKEELRKFCRILALSEERIYNKREETLRNIHPLAIQVNLATGVANGVLVVRDIQKCANLLLRILTNTMEFDVSYNNEINSWVLKETLTESIYRVVTTDQKITNCFWNFYPEQLRDRRHIRPTAKVNLERKSK
jgi:hypothetical protein